MRARREDLETKAAELQRQSKATEGGTGGKKEEKVGSDAPKELRLDDGLTEAELAELLRKVKLLVKAREELIEQKNELRKDIDRAYLTLRRFRLGFDLPECNPVDHSYCDREMQKPHMVLEVVDCAMYSTGLHYLAKIVTFDPFVYYCFWCPAEVIEEGATELISNFHKWWTTKAGPQKFTFNEVVFIPVGKDYRKGNTA